MLLVLNCIVGPSGNFDRSMDRILSANNIEFETIKLDDYNRPLEDIERFDRMLISGSSIMHLDEHFMHDLCADAIRKFIQAGKGVLGICYGHQTIARSILGIDCIGRNPEFGFVEIELEPSPLFEGMKRPFMVLESHYETVERLSDDFHVLGHSATVGVEAFQYKDFPVWGVQFHPEYNIEQGKDMMRRKVLKDPKVEKLLQHSDVPQSHFRQNEKVLVNFATMTL